MDKVRLKIINPSSGGVQYVARDFTVNIPGHRFEDNPFETEIPGKCLDHFKGIMRSRFPFIRGMVIEPVDPDEEPERGKDEFLSACKVKKGASKGLWLVTTPDGQEVEIEGSTRKQAARTVCDKLYGDVER